MNMTTQLKLTRSEWNSTEIPVSANELEILKLINKGYSNVNLKYNQAKSLISFLKIEYSPAIDEHLYVKYFMKNILSLLSKYRISYIDGSANSKFKLKSADKIRIDKNNITINKTNVYECVLIEHIENIIHYQTTNKWMFYYYTLFTLLQNTVTQLNTKIVYICNTIISEFKDKFDILYAIKNTPTFIEKNVQLLQYADVCLYDHQKRIFNLFHNKPHNPSLSLYIAPTGTGKTLTPIALSNGKRIIFVCAARHVGLALARSAIAVEKKVAFAFGCNSVENIRLHYFAAKEFTKDRKSGAIRKVDNSVGDNVEIMICDIHSYLHAMYYMLAFNPVESLIMYWDEPTISLDYDDHDIHALIKNMWSANVIEKVILSSATLPKIHELPCVVNDFMDKYPNANIHNIISHDCRKTIPIITSNGYIAMPHYLSKDYDVILKSVNHCYDYLTILRYLDLGEIAKFITFVSENKMLNDDADIHRVFSECSDITMKNIKKYYLDILKTFDQPTWDKIWVHVNETRHRLSTEDNYAMNIMTRDSHTLTDGPTIYIANNVEKIAQFCIRQANIPSIITESIMTKITNNNKLSERIWELEKIIENEQDGDKTGEDIEDKIDSKSKTKNGVTKTGTSAAVNGKLVDSIRQLNALTLKVKPVELNDGFVPNKSLHLEKWCPTNNGSSNPFTSDIHEKTVIKIMTLENVTDTWKILLLLGIGGFTNHKNPAYTEIMKELADNQQLFMIIASSDYIYGTNYQSCHGYLGNDLNLTQEKIIQAMGRIGRTNIQQQYSIRMRNNDNIEKLFMPDDIKVEANNMNKLFRN